MGGPKCNGNYNMSRDIVLAGAQNLRGNWNSLYNTALLLKYKNCVLWNTWPLFRGEKQRAARLISLSRYPHLNPTATKKNFVVYTNTYIYSQITWDGGRKHQRGTSKGIITRGSPAFKNPLCSSRDSCIFSPFLLHASLPPLNSN